MTIPVTTLSSSLNWSGVPWYGLVVILYCFTLPMVCSTVILARVTSALWSGSRWVSPPVSGSDPALRFVPIHVSAPGVSFRMPW